MTDRVTLVTSRDTMEQLKKRLHLEWAREDTRMSSVPAQLAPQRARIEQMEAVVSLRMGKSRPAQGQPISSLGP